MPKFAANLTMLFNEAAFLDRFAAARRAGFAGVEYLFPYDYAAADIRARLDEQGVPGTVRVLWALSDTKPVGTQGPVWYLGGKVV